MMGETVECAAISPHLYIQSCMQAQCYQPLHQLHSDFGNFNNGVCRVMKLTIAKVNAHNHRTISRLFTAMMSLENNH